MFSNTHRFASIIVLTASASTSAQYAWAPQETDLKIDISVAHSTIHVGEDLTVTVNRSTSTGRIVRVGNRFFAEILNGDGEDIGPQVTGADKLPSPTVTFGAKKEELRPGNRLSFTWHLTPEPRTLPEGTYKLRIYMRDYTHENKLGELIYSNSVPFTVLP